MKKIIEQLETLRMPHFICDDGWYSCPESGECYNKDASDWGCMCGAEEHNNKLDSIIKQLLEIC